MSLVVHRREPHDVYIGRPSKWGNPFSHQPNTLARFQVATKAEAIERYEAWLTTQPQLMAALPELRGKRLGCWCAPSACHGDVLARLANAPIKLVRPFVKAVGGKSWLVEQLVPEIEALRPQVYVEPFLGGGAIALALDPATPKILGDANPSLIDAWLCVQRGPNALAAALERLYERSRGNGWVRATTYLTIREEFNAMVNIRRPMWIERAARFLYLNARCFNGLWRTNRKGFFNVPFAHYASPREWALDDLKPYATHLKKCTVSNIDAMKSVHHLIVTNRHRPKYLNSIVIYADPPYDGTFDGYTSEGFCADDQVKLAAALENAARFGVNVFASNSDTEMVRSLYTWADIETLNEQHSVGSTGARRGKKPCVLIRSKKL